MYNKIFTKILDSSIWLESDTTRIVWLTFIAAMDEDGFAQFAAIGNLANRARVPIEAATEAVRVLSSPDPDSNDPDNEGRRIERVNGGWIILNAEKYRDLVTRAIAQEKARHRVARWREKQKKEMIGNADVTPANDSVTQSDTDTESDQKHNTNPSPTPSAERRMPIKPPSSSDTLKTVPCATIYAAYPRKVGKSDALKAIARVLKGEPAERILERTQAYAAAVSEWPPEARQYIPHPATWFNRGSYDDDPQTWKRNGSPTNQKPNSRSYQQTDDYSKFGG